MLVNEELLVYAVVNAVLLGMLLDCVMIHHTNVNTAHHLMCICPYAKQSV